jgi:hypothetical protein
MAKAAQPLPIAAIADTVAVGRTDFIMNGGRNTPTAASISDVDGMIGITAKNTCVILHAILDLSVTSFGRGMRACLRRTGSSAASCAAHTTGPAESKLSFSTRAYDSGEMTKDVLLIGERETADAFAEFFVVDADCGGGLR